MLPRPGHRDAPQGLPRGAAQAQLSGAFRPSSLSGRGAHAHLGLVHDGHVQVLTRFFPPVGRADEHRLLRDEGAVSHAQAVPLARGRELQLVADAFECASAVPRTSVAFSVLALRVEASGDEAEAGDLVGERRLAALVGDTHLCTRGRKGG